MPRKWQKIIIHHSASSFGNENLINSWHLQRKFTGTGYHFVVGNGYITWKDYQNDRQFKSLIGAIECGRPIDGDEWVDNNEVGAHAFGLNRDSIGVCCIHSSGPYDVHQYDALMHLCEDLCQMFNIKPENVLGHYEVDDNKALCPGIDMESLRNELREALDE